MSASIPSGLLAACLLALPLALACGDKDDTGDGGAAGGDGGATDDGGSTGDGGAAGDGGSAGDGGAGGDYFEPVSLFVTWQVGVIDGEVGNVLYGGGALSNILAFYLVDESWESFTDSSGFCSLTYDLAGGAPATGCTDCFAGAAWTMNSWSLLASDGECDDLDPAVYPDVEGWLQGYRWGIGFGTLSSTVESQIVGAYPQYDGKLVGGYVDSDFPGASSWAEWSWAFAYGIDGAGELDQSVVVDQGGPGGLADGYYVASPLYPLAL